MPNSPPIKARSGVFVNKDGSKIDLADILCRQDAQEMWPFGEKLTGHKRNDIDLSFHHDFINTSFDFREPSSTGDGTVYQENGSLVLEATDGTAEIETKPKTSHRAGNSGFIDFSASFEGSGEITIGGKNTLQLFYNDGTVEFGYVRNGSFTSTEIDYDLVEDTSKLNIYRIIYGYLGVSNPMLMAKYGDRFYKIAELKTEGNLTEPHIEVPDFPIVWSVEGDAKIKCGSVAAGVINDFEKAMRCFVFPNEPIQQDGGVDPGDVTLPDDKSVATLAIFSPKQEYKGKENRITSFISSFANYVRSPDNGSGDVLFQMVLNPELTDDPSFEDIDSDNSVMQVDHTAGDGASVSHSSGGRVVLECVVPYVSGYGNKRARSELTIREAQELGSVLDAGDILVIIAKDRGGNGVLARSTINWQERF